VWPDSRPRLVLAEPASSLALPEIVDGSFEVFIVVRNREAQPRFDGRHDVGTVLGGQCSQVDHLLEASELGLTAFRAALDQQ
jgi:hypothetical protein